MQTRTSQVIWLGRAKCNDQRGEMTNHCYAIRLVHMSVFVYIWPAKQGNPAALYLIHPCILLSTYFWRDSMTLSPLLQRLILIFSFPYPIFLRSGQQPVASHGYAFSHTYGGYLGPNHIWLLSHLSFPKFSYDLTADVLLGLDWVTCNCQVLPNGASTGPLDNVKRTTPEGHVWHSTRGTYSSYSLNLDSSTHCLIQLCSSSCPRILIFNTCKSCSTFAAVWFYVSAHCCRIFSCHRRLLFLKLLVVWRTSPRCLINSRNWIDQDFVT